MQVHFVFCDLCNRKDWICSSFNEEIAMLYLQHVGNNVQPALENHFKVSVRKLDYWDGGLILLVLGSEHCFLIEYRFSRILFRSVSAQRCWPYEADWTSNRCDDPDWAVSLSINIQWGPNVRLYKNIHRQYIHKSYIIYHSKLFSELWKNKTVRCVWVQMFGFFTQTSFVFIRQVCEYLAIGNYCHLYFALELITVEFINCDK